MQNKLRKLFSQPLAVALLAVVVVGGIGSYLLASSSAQEPNAAPAKPSLLMPVSLGTAPYQYIAYSGSLDQTRQATGVQNYFAAFVISTPGACLPAWGGGEAYGMASQRAADIAADFTNLRAAGGEVAVSFGGSSGAELATTCATASQLAAAYGSVVTKYNAQRVDFDIEGPALQDTAVNARRAEAIAALRQAHPNIKIWITLPVNARGLTGQGLDVLSQLRARNVEVNGVNIMAMNYNGGGSKDMGRIASQAAQASSRQLQVLYPETAVPEVWKALGITVMVGQNDTPGEVFTLADAKVVHDFAVAKGVGMLSMWNTGRDTACPAATPGSVATPVQSASVSCSGVQQQPYDFLRALTLPARQ